MRMKLLNQINEIYVRSNKIITYETIDFFLNPPLLQSNTY
jgi:hypothetical protein